MKNTNHSNIKSLANAHGNNYSCCVGVDSLSDLLSLTRILTLTCFHAKVWFGRIQHAYAKYRQAAFTATYKVVC